MKLVDLLAWLGTHQARWETDGERRWLQLPAGERWTPEVLRALSWYPVTFRHLAQREPDGPWPGLLVRRASD